MSDAEFQGKSHEALYAMVAEAKPEHLSEVGKTLKKAFTDLDGISKDLKEHIARVRLEGEGGDALRTWGEQMVMQTTKLAHYVSSVGATMDHASEGLAKARSSMPKPSGSVCFMDPEKERARLKTAETDRQHAMDAMRTVDSYYRTAQADLGKLEEPLFVLPPGMSGLDRGDEWERPYDAPPSDAGADGRAGARRRAVSPSPALDSRGPVQGASSGYGTAASAHASVMGSPPGGPSAGWTTGTNIDSAVTPPSPTSSVPVLDAGGQHSRVAVPHGPEALPAVLPPTPIGGIGEPDAGRGILSLGRPRTDMPMSRGGGLPRPNDGVVGGLPTAPGGEAVKLPRGAVANDELGSVSRGPVGVGGYPGGVSGGPGAHGGWTGRRPVAEPGGVVGGPRGAVSSGTRAEFTPGGSGLVRGTQAVGALPHVAAPPSGAARRPSAARPAYLTEDEETWTSGRRDTVPPVIE